VPLAANNVHAFVPFENDCARDAETLLPDPNPGRWGPMSDPGTRSIDFIDGLRLFGQGGDPCVGEGLSIYLYSINTSMDKRSISFCDGEVLIVPQEGKLCIRTEMGDLVVGPDDICVIPRGVRFSVVLLEFEKSKKFRGYMSEVFNADGFRLPELGVIGANGLAHPLHFEYPKAKFDSKVYENWENVIKVAGKWFHQTGLRNSPFDVVAWRGNLAPYKYSLSKFCVINSVSFDHIDPSIFTVLTCSSSTPGVAACDFVIFPPRWLVADKTFRPPYFHRNVMCEFMGLIRGKYDGKQGGFVPGGSSLHNRMTPHGPDRATYEMGSTAKLGQPVHTGTGLAFMFETTYYLKTTAFARLGEHREADYSKCWQGLPRPSL